MYPNQRLTQEDNELIQLVLMLPSEVLEGKSQLKSVNRSLKSSFVATI